MTMMMIVAMTLMITMVTLVVMVNIKGVIIRFSNGLERPIMSI